MASEDADENVNRGTGGPDGTTPAHDAQHTQGSGASVGQPVDPKIAAAVAAAEAAGPAKGETVRIDSWIWAVRLIKTRSLGATACRGGHVHVNGERVKPAYSVRVGDEVRLRHEGRERVVIVKRLIRKRVGAPVAAQCYIDNSPPPPPREAVAPAGLRDRGAGRPTKRDRRELERLRGLGVPGGYGAFGSAAAPAGFAGSGGPGEPGSSGGPAGSGSGDREGSGGRRETGRRSGSGAGGTGRYGRTKSSGAGRHGGTGSGGTGSGGTGSGGTDGRPRGR
ncbi:heat-shock protein [Streptomyces fodineus]|uniref:Heat-shock protein n=1 Tax=Streptomyces fodineus TaxID=1904616 RepID=A0A1D7YH49_9ACTN|nr:RNA-binding S4 domain-containing protein [Streptomyces fodineus]AOR34937.1 heat-shock protein [Streptomyces fodineus]